MRLMQELLDQEDQLLEMLTPEQVVEATLNRIKDYVDSGKQYAVLTAHRDDHTPKQNFRRNKALRKDIRALGYDSKQHGAAYKVYGGWKNQETGKLSGEHSFLVPNMSREHAHQLGQRHGQQAVLHGEGGKHHFYSTLPGSKHTDAPTTHFHPKSSISHAGTEYYTLQGHGKQGKKFKPGTGSRTDAKTQGVMKTPKGSVKLSGNPLKRRDKGFQPGTRPGFTLNWKDPSEGLKESLEECIIYGYSQEQLVEQEAFVNKLLLLVEKNLVRV